MKDYIQFDGMPVALFTAIVVSTRQCMDFGDWIAPCTSSAGGKSRRGNRFPLLSSRYGGASAKS